MNGSTGTLEITTSPHIHGGTSTAEIMRSVVLAVLPTAAFAVYAFGVSAALLLAVSTASCVLTEHLLCRVAGKDSTIGDWSAAVTGLLLGLTLPPGLPLWMAATGGFFAIALGKILFGGLGANPFNPALLGRAVLQAAFPVAMTTWCSAFLTGRFGSVLGSSLALPFAEPLWDATTASIRTSAAPATRTPAKTATVTMAWIRRWVSAPADHRRSVMPPELVASR